MARNLPQIPNTLTGIPKQIADVLNPVREILKLRFLDKGSNEAAVTRNDLVKLGLVREDELSVLGED